MIYICARHGESGTNLDGKVSGLEVDPELTSRGVTQIEVLANNLRHLGIRRIITSHLRRAVQSAQIVNGILRVELIVAPDYRERDFGVCVGMPLPQDLIELYETNEGMETYDQCRDRYSRMPETKEGDLLMGHSINTPLFLDYKNGRPLGKHFIRFGNADYKVFKL